jgi:hypothetical protein
MRPKELPLQLIAIDSARRALGFSAASISDLRPITLESSAHNFTCRQLLRTQWQAGLFLDDWAARAERMVQNA